MRFCRLSFLLVAVLTMVTSAMAEEKKQKTFEIGLEVGLNAMFFSGTIPSATIENVPLFVRQVPVHRDDWNAGVIRTIPFDTVAVEGTGYLFLDGSTKVAPTMRVGPVILRGELLVSGIGDSNDDRTPGIPSPQEWSEWVENNERGYGTALVYYQAFLRKSGKIKFHPVWEAELTYHDFSVLAGTTTSPISQLWIQTGWDRYNALEKWQEHHVADFSSRVKYAGLRVYLGDDEGHPVFFEIIGGVRTMTAKTISDEFRDARFQTKKSGWLVGFEVGLRFPVVRF
jgi:hypothetical protein